MPKAKWNIDADEPEDLQPFATYDGPDVPAGVYNVKIPRVSLKANKNDDHMLFIISEIAETRPEKKRYNGAVIFANQNVTEQGAPFLKAFLTSIGVTWSDFINKTILEAGDVPAEKGDPPVAVASIGRVKFVNEPEARVQVKVGTYEGNRQLQIAQWLPPADDDDNDAAEPDSLEEDDDSDPFK